MPPNGEKLRKASEINAPSDREDPRDCNPMFKRLPAEVVARRSDKYKAPAEPTQAEEVYVDLDMVLQKKAEGRAKWLVKALQQAQDGRLQSQDLYDIVASSRFTEELTEKTGRKCYRALHANLTVFSQKQRKFLEKECQLAKEYAATAWGGKDGQDDPKKAQDAASSMEEMMARCRAFVRDKQTERGERDEGGADAPPAAPPAAQVSRTTVTAAPAPPAVPVPAKLIPAGVFEAAEPAPARREAAPPPAGGRASRSESRASPAPERRAEKEKEKEKPRERRSSSRSAKKEKEKPREREKEKEKPREREKEKEKDKKEKAKGKRKASPSASSSRSAKKKDKKEKGKRKASPSASSSRSAKKQASKKRAKSSSSSSSSSSDRRAKKRRK